MSHEATNLRGKFNEYCQAEGISLEHLDDWEPHWKLFMAGVNCYKEYLADLDQGATEIARCDDGEKR